MIHCRVLGPVELAADDGPVPPELLWRKHLGLLVYLLRSPKRSRTREHLVGLLWPEKDESAARHSLNEGLRVLRRTVGDAALESDAGQIRLRPGAVRFDVEELEAAVAGERWAAASGLIAGEFLEGFGIPGSEPFEAWLAGERRHWTELSVHALARHAGDLQRTGQVAEALSVARRAESLDPRSELAGRAVMTALALLGDASAAGAHFEQLAARLAADLGTEPSEATRALARRIRTATGPRSQPAVAQGPPHERRSPLVGRSREIEKLLTAWAGAQQSRAAVLMVEGQAGAGKSRLVEEVARRVRLEGGTVSLVRAVEADRSEPGAGLVGLARGGLLAAPGIAAASAEHLAPFAKAVPEWAERFPGAIAVEGASLPAAFTGLLAAALGEGPLLLAIDDAHWMDPSSLHALAAVHRDHAARPLGVLLAFDSGPAGEELEALRGRLGREVSGALVRLDPLDGEALRALVRWAVPSYDAAAVERLSRRLGQDSAGIPFLAVELLTAVAHGLDLLGSATLWPEPQRTLTDTMPGDLPDALVAALRITYRRLSRDGQLALAAAALLVNERRGRVTPEDLALVTGLGAREVEAALDELEWRRWLEADGRGYSFVARVAARVIEHDMLTRGQRRRFLDRLTGTPAS